MPNAFGLEGFQEARKCFEEAVCGCWTQSLFHPDGELLELHTYICEHHMAMAALAIEMHIRSENAQLTLPLPSPRATGGETNGC